MKKLLLVEDDPMLSEIYKKKLSLVGFDVCIAMTGGTAVDMAIKEQPDVILLDLIMPEEDGFEVLRTIKENERSKKAKVIIFSNLSQEEDKQRARDLGACGFVTKAEYTPQQAVEKIYTILRETEKIPFYDKEALLKERIKLSVAGKKVLLIEDQEIFIEIFGKRMKDEGFELTFARNGAWGLNKALKEKFDIIVTDILMPEIDGIELIRRIRKESKLNMGTPIFAFSNSIEVCRTDEVLTAGANQFFLKSKTSPTAFVHEMKLALF